MNHREIDQSFVQSIQTDRTPGGVYHVEDFVRCAKELGLKRLLLADSSVTNYADFTNECHSQQIEPLFGLSLELDFPRHCHITVIAENEIGLSTIAKLAAIIDERKIDRKLLQNNVEGLLVIADANAYSQVITDVPIGKLFFGLSPVHLHADYELAAQMEAPAVILPSAWRISAENLDTDFYISIVTQSISMNYQIPADILSGKSVPEWFTNELYSWAILQSADTFNKFIEDYEGELPKLADIIRRTNELFATIDAPTLPPLDVPRYPVLDGETPYELLVERIFSRAREQQILLDEYKQKRIYTELWVLAVKDRLDSVLFADDITILAKNRHVNMFGIGSATCSYINYILGITNVDPIQLGLPFERYLNFETKKQIDTDWSVDASKRQILFDAIGDKLAEQGLGYFHISSFQSFGVSGAYRRVLRIFGFSETEITNIEQSIDAHKSLTPIVQQITDLAENIADKKIANGVTSLHPSKIIYSAKHEFPGIVTVDHGGKNVVRVHNKIAESAINFDLVSSRVVSRLARLYERIGIEPRYIIVTPALVRYIFESPEGIPFVGTPWLTNVLTNYREAAKKAGKTLTIDDLVDAIALSRPGASKSLGEYLYTLQRSIPVDQKIEAGFLADTYGVVLFQEQVLALAKDMAGFSDTEAEVLRRAMTKERSEELFEKYKNQFVDGCVARGRSKLEAIRMYEMIAEFAKYGFLKGHAYALILNICIPAAYIKQNYPQEFYTVFYS